MIDSCGGQYRIIAGLPTPSMGQRLAELGESVWQDITRDPPAREDRSSKDKMKEQPVTPSFNVSDSHVETASVGEVLPDSKLFPLQDRFFKAKTTLKCVTYQFRDQPQVTFNAAKLLSSSPPGLDQGVSNLYAWMLSWVSEAESFITNLPQSMVYDQFLRQELRCTLPSIKQALNDLSQEYFATQESQADFGNFTPRLHKVGGEAEDFLKKPIPIEHGNDLASVNDMNTQLAWHATALRLMDLWKSGREGYKDIIREKLSTSLKTVGLEAAERVYTQSIADFLRRPAFGAATHPQELGKLPPRLSEKTKEFLRLRHAKARQGATVDDTTGVNGNTTKEASQEVKTGADSKAKSKKKNRKKKKSKAKNPATAESPEPAAESTEAGKDPESEVLKSGYLSKEQKKDGLEEHEWVFETTKRELAKHDFDQPGSLPTIYDFIPKESPWGPIDLNVAKAQIKSRVLEQSERLLDNLAAGKDPESGLLKPGYLSKEQKKDGLQEHEWVFEATKREFGKHAFDQPGETPMIYDFIPKDGPWGAIDIDAAKAHIKSRVLEQSEQLLDNTIKIYRVESDSPPRFAWRESREIREGMSMQEMSDGIILKAMQAQFQDELRVILNKRLAEHADMMEAASTLADLKFTPTSSQDSNATIPDFETVAVENNNATDQNELKENVATIREKDRAIKESDASTKENNMTLTEDVAANNQVNTAAEEKEADAKKDSMNNTGTNLVIRENNTKLRGGDAQAVAPDVRKKPANGKGSDSWSVPTGEPVWGGSGSGTGHNSNKRKASGGQKRKLGK